MLYDYAVYVTRNIRRRKIRSYLTMIGVIIGIAAIVSLISIGQGLQNAVSEQFELLGSDKIIISPGSALGAQASMSGGGLTAVKLSKSDLDIISGVKGIDIAGGFITKNTKIEYKGTVKYTFVTGFPIDKGFEIVRRMQNFKIESGREPKTTDTYTATIGYRIYHGQLFGKNVNIGDKLYINGYEFRVTTSLHSLGNNIDDTNIFIPIETSQEIFNASDEYSMIIASSKTGFDTTQVAEDIKKALRKDRHLKEGEENFNVQTTQEMIESAGSILDIIQIVLIGLGAISLLVGGIGIMNTMYTSVLERTKDIGVMKAIGAKNSDILAIFLLESGILGIIGGIIGTGFGIAISKTVESIAAANLGSGILKIYASPSLIIGVILFAFVVGCVSGLMPARQAATMSPVDALRKEY